MDREMPALVTVRDLLMFNADRGKRDINHKDLMRSWRAGRADNTAQYRVIAFLNLSLRCNSHGARKYKK
jgi:hypothetical protein